MSDAMRDVWRIWSGRRRSTQGDRFASIYLAVLVAALMLAPVARGIWLVGSDVTLAAQVAAATPAGAVLAAVAAVWSVAVVAGMLRGPVVLPPAFAHVLATSPLPVRIAFRRPVLLATAWSAASGVAVSVALSVAHHAVDAWPPIAWAGAVSVGAGAGVVTTCCWLIGQTAARRVGVSLAVGAALGSVVVALVPMPPLGHEAVVGLLVALVAVAAIAVPALTARLDPHLVELQSARWDLARGHASMLDLASAADAYRAPPTRGRRWLVVRPARSVTTTIVVRDALAAARTPARLVAGAVAIVLSGVLVAAAASNPAALWVVAVPAGLLAVAASGVLADGLRHAVDAIGAPSLYGLTDGVLVGSHVVLPLVAVVMLVLLGVAVAALLGAAGFGTGVLAGAAMAVGAVGVRLVGLLRATLPAVLLTPVVTPAGDASAALRVVWSLDGVWMAAAVGVAAATVMTAPGAAVLAAAWIVAVGAWRWSRR